MNDCKPEAETSCESWIWTFFFLFPSNLDLMNSCLNFHNITYLFKLHLMQILHKFTRLASCIQNLYKKVDLLAVIILVFFCLFCFSNASIVLQRMQYLFSTLIEKWGLPALLRMWFLGFWNSNKNINAKTWPCRNFWKHVF